MLCEWSQGVGSVGESLRRSMPPSHCIHDCTTADVTVALSITRGPAQSITRGPAQSTLFSHCRS